jgi:hypothetical protein
MCATATGAGRARAFAAPITLAGNPAAKGWTPGKLRQDDGDFSLRHQGGVPPGEGNRFKRTP